MHKRLSLFSSDSALSSCQISASNSSPNSLISSLIAATKNGSYREFISVCIKLKPADIDTEDSTTGNTALFEACSNDCKDDKQKIRHLIQLGANPFLANNEKKETPIQKLIERIAAALDKDYYSANEEDKQNYFLNFSDTFYFQTSLLTMLSKLNMGLITFIAGGIRKECIHNDTSKHLNTYTKIENNLLFLANIAALSCVPYQSHRRCCHVMATELSRRLMKYLPIANPKIYLDIIFVREQARMEKGHVITLVRSAQDSEPLSYEQQIIYFEQTPEGDLINSNFAGTTTARELSTKINPKSSYVYSPGETTTIYSSLAAQSYLGDYYNQQYLFLGCSNIPLNYGALRYAAKDIKEFIENYRTLVIQEGKVEEFLFHNLIKLMQQLEKNDLLDYITIATQLTLDDFNMLNRDLSQKILQWLKTFPQELEQRTKFLSSLLPEQLQQPNHDKSPITLITEYSTPTPSFR